MFVFTTDIKQIIKYVLLAFVALLVTVFLWTYSHVVYMVQGDKAKVEIFYFIPMKTVSLEQYIYFTSELEDNHISYQYKWISPFKMEISLNEESAVQGQEVLIEIRKLPSKLSFVHKSKSFALRFEATPALKSVSPVENVNTKGNVLIRFNTFIEPESVKKYIKASIPGTLYPRKIKQGRGEGIDYSQWVFEAEQKLKYNSTYQIDIHKGLRSFSGKILEKEKVQSFRTTTEPKIIATFPKNEEKNINLYPKIKVISNQPIASGRITIDGMKGTVEVGEEEVIFTPQELLLPNTRYQVKAKVISKHYEPSKEVTFTFFTSPIREDVLWIEVLIGREQHKMIVHQGEKNLREFPVGLDPSKFSEGVYRIRETGSSFYAPDFITFPSVWIGFGENKYIQNTPPKYEKAYFNLRNSNCIFITHDKMLWLTKKLRGKEMLIVHK